MSSDALTTLSLSCPLPFILRTLSDMASEIAEEYRPGNARSLSDAQVGDKLAEIAALYRRTAEGIRQYEGN